MHLADAFIQSDLKLIQAIHFFCQYVLGVGDMTKILYHDMTHFISR